MGLLLGQKCLFKLETRGHISTLFYWGPPPPQLPGLLPASTRRYYCGSEGLFL